jgi:penicillin-binding protein 1B
VSSPAKVLKVRIPRGKGKFHFSDPVIRAAAATFIIICTVLLGIFAYYWVRYEKIIDHRMRGQIFANSAKIFAAPKSLHPNDPATAHDIGLALRRAGYTSSDDRGESKLGAFRIGKDGIEIQPGPDSYHSQEGALVKIAGGKVDSIKSLKDGQQLGSYELEPQLVTALFASQDRSKQRLVTYDEIPTNLINAVIAIEDRRFFEHSGVNFFRFAEAALIDLRTGRRGQGASTLTMQIARGFFLTPEKSIKRKATEMLIAMELEQRFSKRQIFELYANYVDLGQRGSFTIKGFGEAAQAYFGKDVKSLNLQEAALLAGLVQRPSYLSPYRHPERAMERRNLVLNAMVETGAISKEQAETAKAAPLALAPPNVEASDAPYFVDLVKDTLTTQFSEDDLNNNGYRIYSTIDPDLQKVAADAVEDGIKGVDELVTKMRTRRVKNKQTGKTETKVLPGPMPQIALIAMDPQTGQVLALVGGRNYGQSQLNHVMASRPTGSIFKPFVYATAMATALNPVAGPDGQAEVFTPTTMVDDSPATFQYGDQTYEPHNFKDEFFGPVALRFALAHSLNLATIKLAEEVGFDNVAALAKSAGVVTVKPTPAMAIGAYDATPMQMAGAYTAFANAGLLSTPMLFTSVRDAQGDVIQDYKVQQKQIMDARVAFVTTSLMEGVINNGTAAGVRAMGFTAPAAGKTGTSHDAWFAGYTSNLLCIVWVGNDDYSDIKLEGAHAAAPIWAKFMMKAVKLPQYSDVKAFTPPAGVVELTLDKVTNKIATATCPEDYQAAFIAGTEPHETCDQPAADQRNAFQKLFGLGPKPAAPAPVSNGAAQPQPGGVQTPAGQQKEPEKKKGFWHRLFGGGDDDKKQQQAPPPPPQGQQQPPH